MKKPKYIWKLGQTPPVLDRHSVAKHNVLREYLKLYVSVLTANPRRDRLQLTLVDGFCGGGLYRGPLGETRPGSPLIMLEAMAAAETLAKASRKKEFSLATEFYFIDEDESACQHLNHILAQSAHQDQTITVLHGAFESYVQKLIDRIKSRGMLIAAFLFSINMGTKTPLCHFCAVFFGNCRMPRCY